VFTATVRTVGNVTGPGGTGCAQTPFEAGIERVFGNDRPLPSQRSSKSGVAESGAQIFENLVGRDLKRTAFSQRCAR
jgi:hypothetical protein